MGSKTPLGGLLPSFFTGANYEQPSFTTYLRGNNPR